MKKFKVGLQLFSIREEMAKDMDKALAAVKEIGYDYVEFAGFYDKPVEEIKALLKKHGLEAVSVHQAYAPLVDNREATLEYLKELGVKYCTIPSYPYDKFTNEWDETVKFMTELGDDVNKKGMKLLYHNHEFEFEKKDGEPMLNRLYEEVPSEYLNPQFDTCWVHYAGVNPAEHLKKYAGRIEVVHIKDFVCDKFGAGPVYELIGEIDTKKGISREDNGFRYKPIGSGIQDWKAILEACEEAGTEYVIVEQDSWYDSTGIEEARKSRQYLKDSFGI